MPMILIIRAIINIINNSGGTFTLLSLDINLPNIKAIGYLLLLSLDD